jgi:hypothetical protein
MNIPVCVRDGCETGFIQIGRFQFEIDLTKLLTIIGYARLEMRNSLICNRDQLDTALRCMEDILHIEMRIAPKPTDSDDAKNLARYQNTGCGGHTDLDKIRAVIFKEARDRKVLQAEREFERDLARLDKGKKS